MSFNELNYSSEQIQFPVPYAEGNPNEVAVFIEDPQITELSRRIATLEAANGERHDELADLRGRVTRFENAEIRRELEKSLQSKERQTEVQIKLKDAEISKMNKARILLIIGAICGFAFAILIGVGIPMVMPLFAFATLSTLTAGGAITGMAGSAILLQNKNLAGDFDRLRRSKINLQNSLLQNQKFLRDYLPQESFINFVKELPNYRQLLDKHEIYELYDAKSAASALKERLVEQGTTVETCRAAYNAKCQERGIFDAAVELTQFNAAVAEHTQLSQTLETKQREELLLSQRLGLIN